MIKRINELKAGQSFQERNNDDWRLVGPHPDNPAWFIAENDEGETTEFTGSMSVEVLEDSE